MSDEERRDACAAEHPRCVMRCELPAGHECPHRAVTEDRRMYLYWTGQPGDYWSSFVPPAEGTK